MEKPVDIGALKELVDVPGYFVDVERQEVWSLQKRGFLKQPTWFKLRVRPRARANNMSTFFAYVNGDKKELTFGRAVYAASHGLPYYDLSLSAFNFYYEQHQVRLEEKGRTISRGHKKRIKEYDRHREENVKKNIKVLCLLLKAYRGNPRSLVEYVYDRKEHYLHVLRYGQSYRVSKERAEIGFRLALDRLMDVIDNGGGIICDFDGWFVKTAYKLQQKLDLHNSKHIQIEAVKELYS